IPYGLMAVSGSGFQTTAIGLAQEPIDVAKRTAFASLPSLAASRAAVSGFAGFDREVLVTNYAPPADCSGTPCSASCPTVGGGPPAGRWRSTFTSPTSWARPSRP